jgi:hypothetical protein
MEPVFITKNGYGDLAVMSVIDRGGFPLKLFLVG